MKFIDFGLKKIAYIKNGDVVEEYRQNLEQKSVDGDLGYLGRILDLSEGIDSLLISYSNHGSQYITSQSRALVYPLEEPFVFLPKKILNNIMKVLVTLKLLVSFRPDCIICGTIDPSFWGAFVGSRVIRRPIILSCHGALELSDSVLGSVRKTLHKYFIKHCDAVLCNGPFLKVKMLEAGVDPGQLTEFLPTFGALVASSKHNRMCEKLGKGYILFVGRLEENKGVYDLLYAFRRISAFYPPLRLVYAGIGSCLEDLKRLTVEWDIEKKVHFLGNVAYAKLGSVINSSKFVVTPTRSTVGEGICKAVLEALIMGKPVVAPDYGPFPYIVRDRREGLLFTQDSVDDLTFKIHELMEDKLLFETVQAGALSNGKRFLNPKTNFTEALMRSVESFVSLPGCSDAA